jgi:hypothetical protein
VKRKFLSEFGINMVGLGVLLLQQDDFPQLSDPAIAAKLDENPCHIYTICRRPRMMFDQSSIKLDGKTISGDFLVQDANDRRAYPFAVVNGLGENDLRIECPYPHTQLRIYDEAGDLIHRSKAASLATLYGSRDVRSELALEVLYVGQAFGRKSKRTASERIRSHSTLQSIYSEAILRSPDKEIWIVLWHFEPRLIASFDGRWNQYEASSDQDDAHLHTVLNTPLNEQQQINFTEAALINYFKPQYNYLFRDVFPSPAHRTYSQCYDLDINSLTVEVNTEDFHAPLWSENVQREWHHIITYHFHSTAERRSMFDPLVPDEYSRNSR